MPDGTALMLGQVELDDCNKVARSGHYSKR